MIGSPYEGDEDPRPSLTSAQDTEGVDEIWEAHPRTKEWPTWIKIILCFLVLIAVVAACVLGEFYFPTKRTAGYEFRKLGPVPTQAEREMLRQELEAIGQKHGWKVIDKE